MLKKSSLNGNYGTLYQIDEMYIEEIKLAIALVYDCAYIEKQENIRLIKRELNKTQTDIDTIKERYTLGIIKEVVYITLLGKYEIKKNEILIELSHCQTKSSNLKKVINFGIYLALNPIKIKKNGKVNAISAIQNFVFPKGIFYNREFGKVQTLRINSFFALIS